MAAADPSSDVAETDPASLARLVSDLVVVEAWSHQHCGTEHPFCLAWPTFTTALASSALSSEPDTEAAAAATQQLMHVAIAHSPSELDHLGQLIEDASAGEVTAPQERAAEAAYDSYDTWVEDHCRP